MLGKILCSVDKGFRVLKGLKFKQKINRISRFLQGFLPVCQRITCFQCNRGRIMPREPHNVSAIEKKKVKKKGDHQPQ